MAISVTDPTQSVLEAAMRGAELNQTLLTSDLANADTPNFEPSSVNFQTQLATAIDAGASPGQVNFQPSTQAQTTNTNGNGVDPEQTSADLAENGLLYDALAEVVAARNQTLQYAIGAGA